MMGASVAQSAREAAVVDRALVLIDTLKVENSVAEAVLKELRESISSYERVREQADSKLKLLAGLEERERCVVEWKAVAEQADLRINSLRDLIERERRVDELKATLERKLAKIEHAFEGCESDLAVVP